jgi:hypothetical protein
MVAMADCAEGATDVADMGLIEHGTLVRRAVQFKERIVGSRHVSIPQ